MSSVNTKVILNGVLTAAENATVSILDRGFLYGDSVYEVLRAYDGVPFAEVEHLERMEASAARIGMRLPVERPAWSGAMREALDALGDANAYLRLVATRGAGRIGLDPGLAANPSWMVIAQPLELPPAEVYEHGAEMALVSVRRNLKSAVDPQAKTGNYLNSVMALREARENGAFEALMLDHQDFVTEGASSNIFVVLGGVLQTPPVSAGILRGITREVILGVTREAQMRVLELPLHRDTLFAADEVFISSSIREIVPIKSIDARLTEAKAPGPITQEVMSLFRRYVQTYTAKAGAR